MVKIRQVLRCHATGLGSKTIAAHLGISHTTVKKYIHIYQTCGKSFAEIMSMDDMEHLPKNQQKYLTWDPADLLKEASDLHPDLEVFLEKVIDEKKYPEQAYKSCRGRHPQEQAG